MKKDGISLYLKILPVFVGLAIFALPMAKSNNFADAKAKKKSKWQVKLEKRNVPLNFWRKYLPKVSRKECDKAIKKYSAHLKNNPAAYISQNSSGKYLLHQNISTTFFWVGEEAGEENGYIPNNESAWDEKWMEHFGGVDDPDSRSGYFPASFTPLENPFYFALPYNDFDGNGNRKESSAQTIPWILEKTWNDSESMCKNRWIKITHGSTIAYAQWEDVGPFEEDDASYVFGSSAPHSAVNNHAGLDVSPAVRDYLGLGDMSVCDWQFVDSADVPEGPWKQTVTISNIYWE